MNELLFLVISTVKLLYIGMIKECFIRKKRLKDRLAAVGSVLLHWLV